jgi:hypothetical protein
MAKAVFVPTSTVIKYLSSPPTPCLVHLLVSLVLSNANATMDSNNAPNAQPRVTATIDIPDPPPWRVLEGDANTQDYGWRQPRYNAQVMERGFDDDIEAVLLNPALPFGFHFLTAAVLVGELERLADSRQTKFEGKPMKDGSNLWEFNRSPDTEEVEVVNGSEGLRHMYHYSKDVLEMLYRNNLVTIEENTANPTIEEMLRNLDQQQCHRLYDLLIRGCYSAAAYEAARLRDPAFGPAFALGFEWVPAFRESVRDGMLSIQAALWWSIEHAYDPIPHMQQVSARRLAIGTFGVKLTCDPGHGNGTLSNQTFDVPSYTRSEIRADARERTCRRHPHRQAHSLAVPRRHVQTGWFWCPCLPQ